MGKVFFAATFFFAICTSRAQSVEGSWFGRADVIVKGSNSNYLTEFILKQKGTDVEGVFGYYFKDVYQSFFVRGTYNRATRQVSIRNLPLLFYASSTRSGIECPMHFQGTLLVARAESTLKGSFYTDKKYQYTCPELSVNMVMDRNENNTDSALKSAIAGKRFWSPAEDDVLVNAAQSDAGTGMPMIATVSNNETIVTESAADDQLIAAFGRRNTILQKEIVVFDDSILVSFYDNGDIDDDTISVFLNKKPILARRGLTSRALNIYIGLDSTRDIHELSMFADNLGQFPPNTALMVISDGEKRYEIYLSASLKQNASVRLRRPSTMRP